MTEPSRAVHRLAHAAALLMLLAVVPAAAQEEEPSPSFPPPQHVVLITIDSLRADRVGAYGHDGAQTPVIDALADGSVRFERAFAHASTGAPSIASLMTGLLPARHGVYDDIDVLAPTHATLATLLRSAGFRTAAFVGNRILSPERGLAQGFEQYTREFAPPDGERGVPENPAAALNAAALQWLGDVASDQRLFLWVHYNEPHGPYQPPGFVPSPVAAGDPMDRVLPESESDSGRGAIPAYQWLGHGRRSEYVARYDGEIADVDRQLGMLLEALREKGVLGQALVILTADHGEAFGEDDLHCAHGEGLSDALLRVPLLLRLDGASPALRTERVRLIDVLPTLVALLDLPAPELDGQTLLENRGDRNLVAQTGRLPQASWRRGIRGNHELREARGGRRLELGFDIDPDGSLTALGRSQLGRMERFLSRRAPWPTPRRKAGLEPHDRR